VEQLDEIKPEIDTSTSISSFAEIVGFAIVKLITARALGGKNKNRRIINPLIKIFTFINYINKSITVSVKNCNPI